MGKKSDIAWTDHTFNPWWGCVEVSPACDNCYARTFDHRLGNENWGKEAPRRFFGDKHWNEPLKWNRDAEAAKKAEFVFCASMADVFERYTGENEAMANAMAAARHQLWELVRRTRWLTWLFLTKRPKNIETFAPADIRSAPNAWFGTTIESPDYLWRADALIEAAQDAPVRFLSMEPLLAETSILDSLDPCAAPCGETSAVINWVIMGCESGVGARYTPTDWYRKLIYECDQFGADAFLKQAPRGADGITSGQNSWLKLKDGIVEQPYLDGVQHIARPRAVTP